VCQAIHYAAQGSEWLQKAFHVALLCLANIGILSTYPNTLIM